MGSCTINEELEIKNDGSGILHYKNDLGKMIELVKSFDTDGKMSKDSSFKKKVDSTILMKSFLDTAKNIPAEKKALFADGKLHVKMDAENDVLKIDMELPYKSSTQLQALYSNLNTTGSGLLGLMDGLTGKEDSPFSPGGEGEDKANPFITIASVYDVTIKNGLYSRKVNNERLQKFNTDNAKSAEQMKGMGSMMGAMDYTIAIQFPRPIKKSSNPKAEISSDKKNILLKVDLLEATEHPEILELEIEY